MHLLHLHPRPLITLPPHCSLSLVITTCPSHRAHHHARVTPTQLHARRHDDPPPHHPRPPPPRHPTTYHPCCDHTHSPPIFRVWPGTSRSVERVEPASPGSPPLSPQPIMVDDRGMVVAHSSITIAVTKKVVCSARTRRPPYAHQPTTSCCSCNPHHTCASPRSASRPRTRILRTFHPPCPRPVLSVHCSSLQADQKKRCPSCAELAVRFWEWLTEEGFPFGICSIVFFAVLIVWIVFGGAIFNDDGTSEVQEPRQLLDRPSTNQHSCALRIHSHHHAFFRTFVLCSGCRFSFGRGPHGLRQIGRRGHSP